MLRPALLAAALAAAFPAHADPELDALRAELQELKSAYETRIQALEARLQQAEAQAARPCDARPNAQLRKTPPAAASTRTSR